MSDRTQYFAEYHLRNRDKRLAQMASRRTPKARRPGQGRRKTETERRIQEQEYRDRWRFERKLCKHLGITMARAREIASGT